MAVPSFVNAGTVDNGTTGTISPGLPASMAANDICILVASTIAGGSIAITTAGSIATWNVVTGSPINVSSGEKLYVWWGVYSSGTTKPVLTPGSDHSIARIAAYRGANFISPMDVQATGTQTSSTTTFSFNTGLTTGFNNDLVLVAVSSGTDTTTAQFSNAFTNANLASINTRLDDQTSSGGGGGFALVEGSLVAKGLVGTWATTLVSASQQAYICFTLKELITASGGVTETASATATNDGIKNQVAAQTESLSAISTQDGVRNHIAAKTESLSAISTQDGVVYQLADKVEPLTVIDATDGIKNQIADQAEPLTVIDTTNGIRNQFAELTDTNTADDTSNGVVYQFADLTDVNTANDTSDGAVYQYADQTEVITATDTGDGTVYQFANLTDNNLVVDTTDATTTFAEILQSEVAFADDTSDAAVFQFADISEPAYASDISDSTRLLTAEILESLFATDTCNFISGFMASVWTGTTWVNRPTKAFINNTWGNVTLKVY